MKINTLYILLLFFLFLNLAPAISAETQKEFTVVIDAGHGGNDTGAIDNGVKEKDINLAVARRLKEDLQKKIKGIKVIMTRSNDTFVTLQGRADIANKNNADLFISIHTNSVDLKNPNRKTVAGASVYALGLHKDKDNLNVAKRENSVIEYEKGHKEKYSGFDPSKDESYIIFEMAQKKNLAQSLRFANLAQKQLVSHALRKDRGVKQAGFWVLWATSMPSVLVELDFICNPAEAEFMASSEGEKKMAEALANAVEEYYKSIKSGLPSKRVSLNSRNKSADNIKLANTSTSKSTPNSKQASTLTSSPKTNSSSSTLTKQVASTNISGNTSGRRETSSALTTVKKQERNDTPPAARTRAKSTNSSRKRRSASSRQSSEQRNVETADIIVKSENSYLASSQEKVESSKVTKKEVVKETPKEKKKRLALEKKQKEKELKEKEALRKQQAKQRELARKENEKLKKEQAKQRELAKKIEKKDKLAQNNQQKNNKSDKKIVVNNSSKTVNNVNASSAVTAGNTSKSSSTLQVSKRRSLNSKRQD